MTRGFLVQATGKNQYYAVGFVISFFDPWIASGGAILSSGLLICHGKSINKINVNWVGLLRKVSYLTKKSKNNYLIFIKTYKFQFDKEIFIFVGVACV